MPSDTSFQDLLARPVGTSEKPKPLPVGSYYCTVKSREFGRTSSEKQTPYCEFKFGIMQAGPDVDPALLAGMSGGVAGREIRESFYLTPDSVYRLEEFLQNGLGLTGMTNQQAVDSAVGRQVIVHTNQELDKKDPSKIYTRVKSFSRVDGA